MYWFRLGAEYTLFTHKRANILAQDLVDMRPTDFGNARHSLQSFLVFLNV